VSVFVIVFVIVENTTRGIGKRYTWKWQSPRVEKAKSTRGIFNISSFTAFAPFCVFGHDDFIQIYFTRHPSPLGVNALIISTMWVMGAF